MRYIVRRIIPSSAARLGCVLGWLVAFFPAICMAILVGEALRRINQIFEQITPVVITVLGQQVARIDFLEILRLSAISQTTARLVENYLATFLALVVVLALAGGFILLIAGLLFTLGYNWLARGGWGLVIELIEEEERPV